MPSICLSSTLVSTMNANMWAINCFNTIGVGSCFCAYQPFASCNSSHPSLGGIKIMKGVPPVSFSELTLYTSRDADLLINYTTNAYSALVVTGTNPNNLTFYPQTASASGAATWFWIPAGQVAAPGNSGGVSQFNRAWGTVGLQGSGADLEISDTNIVVNNVYKIVNLRIGLPQSYTY